MDNVQNVNYCSRYIVLYNEWYSIWVPSDETFVNVDRFMHYTVQSLLTNNK
jgi:hypothetical protein